MTVIQKNIVDNPIAPSAYGRAIGGRRTLFCQLEEHGPLVG